MIHPRSFPKVRISPLLLLLVFGVPQSCGPLESDGPSLAREAWVDEPVQEWPDFALSNEIAFSDTVYSFLANAFLVDTGADTVGVTCKHIFMVFQDHRGTNSISLGDSFRSWTFRSSRNSSRVVATRRLINQDPTEPIGDFAGIKDRDWLIFELADEVENVLPLKIRYTPLGKGETVFAVGRSLEGRHDPDPVLSPFRVYRATGYYSYVQPLDSTVDPTHTSGSPVIDTNGHLVGLVSGAVGRLGVVAGVAYLRQLFDRYGIPYEMPTEQSRPGV